MPTIDINDAYILDNTGRQVDDSVDYANANTNRNLLDNGFFTIRQRGAGPFTGNVYGVDRWRGSNSRTTVTPNTGYITLATNSSGNGLLRQILSEEYAGPLTFSAYVRGSGAGLIDLLDSGGSQLAQEEFSNPGNDWTLVSVTYQGDTPVASVRFRVDVSTSYEIKCAKLERGIYSTLVNDDPPDYAEELAKCQRYFYRVNSQSFGGIHGFGRVISATAAGIAIPTPVTMRATPSVSVSTIGNYRIASNGTAYTPTAFAVVGAEENAVVIQATSSSMSSQYTAVLYSNNGGGYIDLSADL